MEKDPNLNVDSTLHKKTAESSYGKSVDDKVLTTGASSMEPQRQHIKPNVLHHHPKNEDVGSDQAYNPEKQQQVEVAKLEAVVEDLREKLARKHIPLVEQIQTLQGQVDRLENKNSGLSELVDQILAMNEMLKEFVGVQLRVLRGNDDIRSAFLRLERVKNSFLEETQGEFREKLTKLQRD